jgi:D-alanyl-D-alanine carboxypeptidase
MEGMKTGFTNASGFNLIASASRDNKRVLAVVLGGPSARSRDAAMRNILNASWKKASTEKAARALRLAAAPVPEARGKPAGDIATANFAGTRASASAPLLRNAPQVRAVAEVVQQPLQPLPVLPATQPETPARQAVAAQPLAAVQPAVERARTSTQPAADMPAARVVTASAAFGAMPSLERALPAAETPKPLVEQRKPFAPGRGALHVEPLEELADETVELEYAEPIYPDAGSDTSTSREANLSVHMKAARAHAAHALVETAAETVLQSDAADTPAPARTVLAAIQGDAPRSVAAIQANEAEPASNYAGPYHIQVGAFDNVASAEVRHKRVQEIAGNQLRGRPFFLMPVQLAEGMLIRARFAGFEERDAKRVCALLKRRAIECMVLRAPSDENSAVRPSP